MPTDCSHDYDHPIRKGRAHYVCPKCGEDITLALAFMDMAAYDERTKEELERIQLTTKKTGEQKMFISIGKNVETGKTTIEILAPLEAEGAFEPVVTMKMDSADFDKMVTDGKIYPVEVTRYD